MRAKLERQAAEVIADTQESEVIEKEVHVVADSAAVVAAVSEVAEVPEHTEDIQSESEPTLVVESATVEPAKVASAGIESDDTEDSQTETATKEPAVIEKKKERKKQLRVRRQRHLLGTKPLSRCLDSSRR